MATTQNTFTGNGSNLGPFSFTFKWLESTDIKVTVGGVLKTAGTHYNLQSLNYTTKTGGQVLFTAGNAPANGASIRIYRDTDDEALSAVFSSGSAIRAKDLNDNFTQNLYVTQETNNNSLNVDGSNPMVGNLNLNSFKAINSAAPTSGTDLTNKTYVDDRVSTSAVAGAPYFIQDGTGAVNRSWSSKLKDVVSVKDFGAVGDGIANDTAAIQAAINAAETVVFPPGKYLVSSTLQAISKRICLYGQGATIKEASNLTAVISLQTANNSIIDGLHLEGFESLSEFNLNPPSSVDHFFIKCLNSSRVSLSGISAQNKRCLIELKGACDDSSVTNWSLQGFGAVSNFTTGVHLDGPKRCSVSHGTVTSHGSAVLSSSPSAQNVISFIRGINLSDNGVYISSGNYTTVTGCYFENVSGSAIKMRGSFSKATSNTAVLCNVGISVTGNGTTPDAYGANGNTIMVSSNTIDRCRQYPIQVGYQDGYLPRDVAVVGNVITNSSTDGSTNSLTLSVVNGLVFSNNIIDNSKGTSYAVLISGTVSQYIQNIAVCNNIISNSSSSGMRIAYVNGGVVMGNSGKGNADVLAEGRFTENITYGGNICLDNQVLRFGNAYTNPNNIFFGNRGEIQASQAVQNSSLILPNYTTTAYTMWPQITVVPVAVGAVTVSAGNAYVAVGTASSADWKQIT